MNPPRLDRPCQVGNVSFQTEEAADMPTKKPYSNETARLIDKQVQNMVESAYTSTRALLLKHKDDVERVAKRLLDKEILQREDMIELLGKRPFAEKSTYEEITHGTHAATPPQPAAGTPPHTDTPPAPAPTPAV